MRRLLFGVLAVLALFVCAQPVRAQIPVPSDSYGFCYNLTVPQTISASCTITVFDAGTSNLSTGLFRDKALTIPFVNPGAAGTNGTWRFFVASPGTQAYDVRVSGGTPALTPYTILNVQPISGGSFPSEPPYTVFGNCTGSMAAPTFCSIVNAMLTAPGANTQVIYNSSNLYAASQDLTWDNAAKQLAVRTGGATLVRILSDALGGKILFGTGIAPFIKDNSGSGWFFNSASGQDLSFGPSNDPQAFVIGGAGTLPTGVERAGVGSHNGVFQMNDGSSGAGVFSGPLFMAGFDLPNTNHVATVGSLYQYSGGAATTSLWLKESGAGNTGWTQFAMQDDTQTLTNKALQDSTTTITNAGTPTKKFKFDASGITATFTQTLASNATANRTSTFQDASGNVSLGVVSTCGTLAACSPTVRALPQQFFGSAALASGTPSVVTITGLTPAFTSNTTYKCFLGDETTRTNQVFVSSYASGSSFVITGPNTVTDVIAYNCIGY